MILLDAKIFDFIHQLVGKSRLLDLIAIFFADYIGYLLIIVVLFLIFSTKKIKTRIYNSAFILLSALLSYGILAKTIKFFYGKLRPFEVLEFVTKEDQKPPCIDGYEILNQSVALAF